VCGKLNEGGFREVIMLKCIKYTCRLYREEGTVVSVCPELNVSSFGETPEEAVASLHGAVTLFLEEC
jgi:predicted RNase H-like HicB family nuclease